MQTAEPAQTDVILWASVSPLGKLRGVFSLVSKDILNHPQWSNTNLAEQDSGNKGHTQSGGVQGWGHHCGIPTHVLRDTGTLYHRSE